MGHKYITLTFGKMKDEIPNIKTDVYGLKLSNKQIARTAC